MCPEYPCSQLYVMLAIAIALFGVSVTFRDEDNPDDERVFIPAVFVFITFIHLALSPWLPDRGKIVFHFFSLLFLLLTVVLIILSVRDEYWDKEQERRRRRQR